MVANRRAANPLDTAIGARLRVRRRALGLSQQKLAERLGVTFQQVQKYERGSNRIAGSTLLAIAEALDAPASYFLGEATGPSLDGETLIKFAERGASELLTEFCALKSPRLRNAVLQLVRAMANDYDDDEQVSQDVELEPA